MLIITQMTKLMDCGMLVRPVSLAASWIGNPDHSR